MAIPFISSFEAWLTRAPQDEGEGALRLKAYRVECPSPLPSPRKQGEGDVSLAASFFSYST
ncbi:hypothetical protein C7477_12238 [Phyllobacterium leguminum]|uniref:Uncharacterized protein n=1 Tax=Phyllobacterium leguminum TaxID=314237 RepID=A0A318T3K2_9HYPH|nr:hypothetical protein C7477_12238 [Phyllobacterium leguminum]